MDKLAAAAAEGHEGRGEWIFGIIEATTSERSRRAAAQSVEDHRLAR